MCAFEKSTMDESKFTAFLQPIVNAHTLTTESYEVLSRTLTPINIEHFFKTSAPTTGAQVSLKVLKDTLQFFSSSPAKIQFNLTAPQLLLKSTVDSLENVLASNYPNTMLMCEITEFGYNIDGELRDIVTHLRAKGLSFSLDDFGTCQSGYDRLFDLPISQVKVDRKFINNIVACRKQQTLIRHLVNYIPLFNNAQLIFEGVETQTQHNLLMEMGSEFHQGYFYARPAPLKDIRRTNSLAQSRTN
ncbi:EAL domain-containing protein [Vibrio anguillarum]|nr:hypothetical protein CMV05_23080 [Vibrio anguillarum]MBF4249509.1 EAL domain-containing protein [Vibrio anguillarum]MBF4340717.1 EAL domain-containing protein [Vibrio anguillarum]